MLVSPKQRTAALGDSLLTMAVSCPVSVVKVDSVQGGGTTNRAQSILWLPMGLFCKDVHLEK